MSYTAIALVVTAAVIHAGWNLAAKRASTGGPSLVWLSTVAGTVGYAPLAIGILIWTRPAFTIDFTTAIVVSGVLHVCYFLLLQRGYAVGDLSVVYPLARGTGPLLSVVFAVLVLAERPGPLGLVGAAAVVVGILIVSSGSQSASDPVAGAPARPVRQRLGGVGYGLATGVVIASYTVWDARAVGLLAISPVIYDWGNGVVRAAVLTPYVHRRWSRVVEVWRANRREVLIIGLLAPLSYILVLVAFTMAPVSLVAPSRELSIVIATLFGWLLLREPQPGLRLAGAIVVLGGVVAIAAT